MAHHKPIRSYGGYHCPIKVRIILETEIGRVVEVTGTVDDPYFVAHSWDNEERTATTVEGYFETASEAETCLENL